MQASCRVSRTTQLPAHLRDNVREVLAVHVEPGARRRGQAGELMRQVCAEADKAGMVLLVHCRPFGDWEADAQALAGWYAGLGFMPIQAEPLLMARMVDATPRLVVKPVSRAVAEVMA